MFRPHIGDCKNPDCNRTHVPIVVRDGWCDKCHHERKQAKKKAAGKKTGKYTYARQATGEMSLFESIAEKREWVDFVTGEKLWKLTPTQFLHVLPKALNKYPLFKLYEKNIVLGSDDTHFKWDNAPRSELRKDPRWNKMFELEEELKKEYAEWKKK